MLWFKVNTNGDVPAPALVAIDATSTVSTALTAHCSTTDGDTVTVVAEEMVEPEHIIETPRGRCRAHTMSRIQGAQGSQRISYYELDFTSIFLFLRMT